MAYSISAYNEEGVCAGASLIINHVVAIGNNEFSPPMTKEIVQAVIKKHQTDLYPYCGEEYFALRLTIEWAQQQMDKK